MCALCGVLAGRGHWTDASAHPDVFPGAAAGTRARERQARTACVNRVLAFYGLKARDWGGGYVLSTRTGRTRMVQNLSELWSEARALGADCDPLSPALLAHLDGG